MYFFHGRNKVRFNSPPVPILMWHRVELNETENQQEVMATSINTEEDFNQQLKRVVHTVTFEKLSETSVIFPKSAKGIAKHLSLYAV